MAWLTRLPRAPPTARRLRSSTAPEMLRFPGPAHEVSQDLEGIGPVRSYFLDVEDLAGLPPVLPDPSLLERLGRTLAVAGSGMPYMLGLRRRRMRQRTDRIRRRPVASHQIGRHAQPGCPGAVDLHVGQFSLRVVGKAFPPSRAKPPPNVTTSPDRAIHYARAAYCANLTHEFGKGAERHARTAVQCVKASTQGAHRSWSHRVPASPSLQQQRSVH